MLAEWVHWLHRTYDLPLKLRVRPCWPAHRGVVEELAALRAAWYAAVLTSREVDEVDQIKPGDDLASWHERHLHPCLDRILNRYTIADCDDRHTVPQPVQSTDGALLDAARADAPTSNGATAAQDDTAALGYASEAALGRSGDSAPLSVAPVNQVRD